MSATERPVARTFDLTATEITVAVLLAEGLRQREVAQFTDYRLEAVRSQSARIREKTGARSTCHAVALLIRAGIID
jgi:DNA-binding CsgD family transcriptional regulator